MGRRILFVQHASGLGGSAYSLLYTMQGLRDAGDDCVVLLARPNADLVNLYQESGFGVIANEPFALIDHSTVALRPLTRPGTYAEMLQVMVGAGTLQRRLNGIVSQVKCDIVHLNSMPLVPLAHALNKMGVPYAWHVREPPPDQGFRTRVIRNVMRQCPGIIFLSAYDRAMWMGADLGEVISNFVPERFFTAALDRDAVRHKLGVGAESVVVLFLGGGHPAKGGHILAKAIASPALRDISTDWLLPNTIPGPPQRFVSRVGRGVLAAFGSGPFAVRLHNDLCRLARSHRIHQSGFCRNVLAYFVAADVVLFPATLPHFARPVVEAGAVGRPVIASNIGGVNELVEDGGTGLIVPPGSPKDLAIAIRTLAIDAQLRATMGRRGQEVARMRFRLAPQIEKIRCLYDRIAS